MNDRHRILSDETFWDRLEYEATRWFASAPEKADRAFWIDKFLPETAKDTKFGVEFEGVVWVGTGPRIQHQYRFNASVPQSMLRRHDFRFEIEELSIDTENRLLRLTLARNSG